MLTIEHRMMELLASVVALAKAIAQEVIFLQSFADRRLY